jgi:hypothetical protein
MFEEQCVEDINQILNWMGIPHIVDYNLTISKNAE